MCSYYEFAKVYDYLNNEIDYKRKAEYFNSILLENGVKNKGILLDAACGTGNLSIEMTKKHWDVLGCDSSCEMLSIASFKAQKYNYPITFINQKLQDLDLCDNIDAAVCMQDSLNHITDSEDLQKAFYKISSFLNKGSVFIFDLNTIYKHNHILANNIFCYDFDDVYLVWKNNLLEDNIVNIELDIFKKKNKLYERFTESFNERAYFDYEIKDMLDKAGLLLLHIYKSDTFLPPDEETQRVVYVTRKE